jgi:transcriptional regulator with PAS, ATPase and Fis domain
VLPIELPPLRERIGDLEALDRPHPRGHRARSGSPQRELTPTALAVLSAYPWPGNIRELRNVLEQVTLNSDSPAPLRRRVHACAAARAGLRAARTADAAAGRRRRRRREGAIRSALAAAEGKKILAAECSASRGDAYQKLSVLPGSGLRPDPLVRVRTFVRIPGSRTDRAFHATLCRSTAWPPKPRGTPACIKH